MPAGADLSHPGATTPGVARNGFAVVDVETSGLSTRRHRLLQVGIVTLDRRGEVEDTWSSLVALPWRFSRVGARRIHGITRATLRGAPALDEVIADVGARLAGRILVGHNLAFDLAFLQRAARRSGVELDVHGRLDTLVLSRRLDPAHELSHRLVDVSERYGVTLANPHDALADAYATAEILPHLLAAHGVDPAASEADAAETADPLVALYWSPWPRRRLRRLRRTVRRFVPWRRRRSHAMTPAR